MMLNKIDSTIWVVVLLTTISCGDEDDSSRSQHSVSGWKQMKDLSQQEIDRICEDLYRDYETALTQALALLQDPICDLQAYLSTRSKSSTKEDCERIKLECLNRSSDSAETFGSSGDTPFCASSEELSDCIATVSELEKCNESAINNLKQSTGEILQNMDSISMRDSLTCENYGQPLSRNDSINLTSIDMSRLNFTAAQLEITPECQILYDNCPGFGGLPLSYIRDR